MASDDSPFPISPRVVYEKNPLVQVICQLRFPTILAIAAEDPSKFQDKLRGSYPLYERDEYGDLPKDVVDVVARLPIGKAFGALTHKFISEDRQRLISLSRDFVAVSDSKYSRWERFRKDIEVAKGAVEAVYKPAYYERTGLRYRDVIDRDELGVPENPWDSLLSAPLVGLLGQPDTQSYVRGISGEVLLSLTPGAPKGLVRLRHGLGETDGKQVYLIDADFFTEDKKGANDVIGTLNHFNRLAGHLFRWAITPKLHDLLEPVTLDT